MQEPVNTRVPLIQKQHRVEYRDIGIGDLVPWQNNPENRQRDDEIYRDLVDSLAMEGQLQPVTVIPQDNGTFLVADGNRRYRAAKALGWASLRAAIHSDADPNRILDLVVPINLNQKPWKTKDMLETAAVLGMSEVTRRTPPRFRKLVERMCKDLTPEQFQKVASTLTVEAYPLASRVCSYVGWQASSIPTVLMWFATHANKYGRGVTYPTRVAMRTEYDPKKLASAILNNQTLW